MPTAVKPATSALSIMYPDRRVSLPITTRWRCSPRVKMRPAAMPAFMAISGVSLGLLVRPRMPSVPKYLRVMGGPGGKQSGILAHSGCGRLMRFAYGFQHLEPVDQGSGGMGADQ